MNEQINCSYAVKKTSQDYVAVNVSWTQQDGGIDPAAAVIKDKKANRKTGREAWRAIVATLRRAAVYQVNETGVATLRVFRVRSNVSNSVAVANENWARCGTAGVAYEKSKYDLVLIRPLNAWSITESEGYKVESVLSRLSGRQGLVFLANEGNQFEVELCVSHSNEIRSRVVSTLRALTSASAVFGRNDALISDPMLDQLGSLERSLAQASGFQLGTATSWQIGWRPDEVQKLNVSIGFPWESYSGGETRLPSGMLVVQSETLGTLFPGNHTLKDGTLRFSFSGGRSVVLKQPVSDMTVEDALDPTFINVFGDETVSPSIWENSCQTLEKKLGRVPLSSLNANDVLAVIWAAFASREPISKPELRRGNCAVRLALSRERMSALADAGLLVPPQDIPLPVGAYATKFKEASKAWELADDAARSARTLVRDEVSAALVSPSRVTTSAVGGRFTGTMSPARDTGIGRIVFDAPGYEGAIWEGAVASNGQAAYAQGLGTYIFPKSHINAAECPAGQTATFLGSAASNQLKQGRIVYCDGAVFTGVLDSSELAALGRLMFSVKSATHVFYGDFEGRNFGAGGEGVEEVREEREGIMTLTSRRWGIWSKGVYQGQ
jgi:hypothetical protein